jgi:hypothetical protein
MVYEFHLGTFTNMSASSETCTTPRHRTAHPRPAFRSSQQFRRRQTMFNLSEAKHRQIPIESAPLHRIRVPSMARASSQVSHRTALKPVWRREICIDSRSRYNQIIFRQASLRQSAQTPRSLVCSKTSYHDESPSPVHDPHPEQIRSGIQSRRHHFPKLAVTLNLLQ